MTNESMEATTVITLIINWYLMATSGIEPPSIWPIIVPGKDTMPNTAMLAMHGEKDLMTAERRKGNVASKRVAPLPNR